MGSRLYYEWQGREGAPVLLLSPGLGGSAAYWQPQLPALGEHYRILLYDHLGTGRSGAKLPENYSVDDMARELIELLDRQGVPQVDFLGHAFGGLVGLAVARLQPQRVRRLVVAGGWKTLDSHSRRCFEVRINLLKDSGPAAYLQAQPLFLFPADWLSAHAEQLREQKAHQLATFPGAANTLARIGALAAFDASAWLEQITQPTLVITARDDMLVPWTASKALADSLPNGQFACLDYGGHACSVTAADRFNEAVLVFFRGS